MSTCATNRTPLEEIAKRAGEAGAGIAAGGYAIALGDFKARMDAARQRVRDGHKAGLRALGMEDAKSEQEPDTGGNVIVTGDIYGDRAVQALQEPTQPGDPTPTTPTGITAKHAIIAALAAALLGGSLGAGVPWMLGLFNQQQPTTFTDTDTDQWNDITIGPLVDRNQ